MQNSNPNNGQHVILMEQKLTIPKFKQFNREVQKVADDPHPNKSLTLVLSSPGGDISLGLESVLALENINYPLRAKIYRAGSIAALAALMAPYREIVEHGEIWLHLGNTIEIESCDISADGKIPKKTFELLTLCRSKTLEKLKQVAPKLHEDGKMWSTFIAHNHLRLNAEQCLHYNLVHRIC